MSKPYDAATKVLVEKYPLDWLRQLGISRLGPTVAINADLSTVTTEADRVFMVKTRLPWIMHIEFQSGADSELPERLLGYNALLRRKHKLPIHSAVVLLRPEADHPSCDGRLRYKVDASGGMDFRYQVLRLWKLQPQQFLDGGLGTLPLALLAHTSEKELPGIIDRMDARIRRGKLKPNEAGSLWAATYVLMGLRLHTAAARGLLKGVMDMKESVTYQAIIAEGRLDEARRMVLTFGSQALGKPSQSTIDKLNSIRSTRRLEALAQRILAVKSWDALLDNLVHKGRS